MDLNLWPRMNNRAEKCAAFTLGMSSSLICFCLVNRMCLRMEEVVTFRWCVILDVRDSSKEMGWWINHGDSKDRQAVGDWKGAFPPKRRQEKFLVKKLRLQRRSRQTFAFAVRFRRSCCLGARWRPSAVLDRDRLWVDVLAGRGNGEIRRPKGATSAGNHRISGRFGRFKVRAEQP